MPTAHCTEPRAMSLNPLPVGLTLDPAICMITVQHRALATEWQLVSNEDVSSLTMTSILPILIVFYSEQ
jgi:hypothetical protein